MRIKSYLRFSLILLLIMSLSGACKTKKKDCRGRRKQVKTDMGGWL